MSIKINNIVNFKEAEVHINTSPSLDPYKLPKIKKKKTHILE